MGSDLSFLPSLGHEKGLATGTGIEELGKAGMVGIVVSGPLQSKDGRIMLVIYS